MSGVGALRSASGTGSGAVLLHGRAARRAWPGRRRSIWVRSRGYVAACASGMRPSGRPTKWKASLAATATCKRLRIGVADVLGREDHHAARDEQRVLAGLEHAHQPVDRGVGIAAAHALDERGDDVVVLLAALVVAERLLLQRPPRRAPGRARAVAALAVPGSPPARARRARCARRRGRARRGTARAVGSTRRARARRARARGRRARGRSGCAIVVGVERLEHEHARPRQQRRDHLERRVLGRGADAARWCRPRRAAGRRPAGPC